MNEKAYWKMKKVFIVGGTSGLGQALALQLSNLGAVVAVLARKEKGIFDLTKKDPKIFSIKGDISKKASIHAIAGEVETKLGSVDVLFNVASFLGKTPLRMLIDTECEDFERVLQTNLLGPFRLSKILASSMILRNNGVVVNISSDAAVNAYPNWGSYSVSKAALDHMSLIFDAELKNHGVRFFSIDPGDMNTPMHFAAVPDADPKKLRDPEDSARQIQQFVAGKDFTKVRRII